MAAKSVRNQHRHYKTLMLLVVSMTIGTYFLFWIDKASPSHRRAGLQTLAAAAASPWNCIDVQTVTEPAPSDFHFRIDESGRLFRSDAWQPNPTTPQLDGTIQVRVTPSVGSNGQLTSVQRDTLTRLIDQLQQEHHIPASRIRPNFSR